MKARLPRSTCLLGDSLSFGAADRYKLPSHTTSRQNQPPQPRSLGSIRAIAFRSRLPPIGPIKDSHLQSLRHARRNFRLRLRLRLQNTAVYLTPILSLNLEHKWGGGHRHHEDASVFQTRSVAKHHNVPECHTPPRQPLYWWRLDTPSEGAAHETSAGSAAGDGDGRVWG